MKLELQFSKQDIQASTTFIQTNHKRVFETQREPARRFS